MPWAPVPACAVCGRIGPCPQHPKDASRNHHGVGFHSRYGGGWETMVKRVIAEEPWCRLRLAGCTGRSQTADHIIRRREGGTNERSNLRGACHHCNYRRRG